MLLLLLLTVALRGSGDHCRLVRGLQSLLLMTITPTKPLNIV
jgi:hypothetical protein